MSDAGSAVNRATAAASSPGAMEPSWLLSIASKGPSARHSERQSAWTRTTLISRPLPAGGTFAGKSPREAHQRLDVVHPVEELAHDRDAVDPILDQQRPGDGGERVPRLLDPHAIVDLEVAPRLGRRVRPRGGDGLAQDRAGQARHHHLVVEGQLGLEIAVGEVAAVRARRADAPTVEQARLGAERVAQAGAEEPPHRRLPRPRADRGELVPGGDLEQRGRLERADRVHVRVDARAQPGVFGVGGDRLEPHRHLRQVGRARGRLGGPGEIDHHRVDRVGSSP